MTWRVAFDADLGYIQIVCSGVVTKPDCQNATAEALALAQGDGPHLFLADLLDAVSVMSTLDIYRMPSEWETAGASRKNRLAIVAPEGGSLWDDARFCETTCRNRGWHVKTFASRQPAADWLTAQGATPGR